MREISPKPIHLPLMLLVALALISGCSSSSEDPTGSDTSNVTGEFSTTRLNVDITVPVYASDALQVRVAFGDLTVDASWVVDETWSASIEVPANTERPLVVTFSDDNGELTLADYEASYRTGSGESESFEITSDQFDSDNLDNDNDGLSNLQELLTGTNPLVSDSTTESQNQALDQNQDLEEFDLITASYDLRTRLAGFQLDRMYYFVWDLAYIVAQQTTIQWPDDDYYQVQVGGIDQPTLNRRTICEGASECRILPGTYTIINLTADDRTELVVPYIEPEDLPHATLLPDRIITASGVGSLESVTVERTQYNCEHGGRVITERWVDDSTEQQTLLIDPTEHELVSIRERSTTNYLFDQCRMTLNDTSLSDGGMLVNGDVHSSFTYHNFSDYTGYQTNSVYRLFDNFTMLQDTGAEYRVHGETENYTFSREDRSFVDYLRNTELEEYLVTSPDGEITESVSDARYQYQYTNAMRIDPTGFQLITEEVSGSVQNADSAGQVVTVSTSPRLYSDLNYNRDEAASTDTLFSGTIEMFAEDGSFLYMNANPFIDEDNFRNRFADLNYTGANGEQVQIDRARYFSPRSTATICIPRIPAASTYLYTNATTKRLYCSNGGTFAPF